MQSIGAHLEEVDSDASRREDARGGSRELFRLAPGVVPDEDASRLGARLALLRQEVVAQALRGLEDDEVVHAVVPRAHLPAQARGAELEAGARVEARRERRVVAGVHERLDLGAGVGVGVEREPRLGRGDRVAAGDRAGGGERGWERRARASARRGRAERAAFGSEAATGCAIGKCTPKRRPERTRRGRRRARDGRAAARPSNRGENIVFPRQRNESRRNARAYLFV